MTFLFIITTFSLLFTPPVDKNARPVWRFCSFSVTVIALVLEMATEKSSKLLKIAVGADGSGTTFDEIVAATHDGRLRAKVVLLFSNKQKAPVVEKAKQLNIPVLILNGSLSKDARDQWLCAQLPAYELGIDLICLAGYLKFIPECLVRAFPHRIINSHPALDLHRFGGKGMYGMRVPEAIIKNGLHETGSTIHFVTEKYDDPAGIIAQTKPIQILPDDTPESLLGRQLPQERALYIEVIKMFSDARLP